MRLLLLAASASLLLAAPAAGFQHRTGAAVHSLDKQQPFRFPALSKEAAWIVKIFPQHRTAGATRELVLRTIVLRGGCLRFDRPAEGDPFVVFPADTGLALDEEGRLAFISRDTGKPKALVGEPLALSGGAGRPVTDPAIAGPVNAACGPGKVVYSGAIQSRAAFERRVRR